MGVCRSDTTDPHNVATEDWCILKTIQRPSHNGKPTTFLKVVLYSIWSRVVGSHWHSCVTKITLFSSVSSFVHPFKTQSPGWTFPHSSMCYVFCNCSDVCGSACSCRKVLGHKVVVSFRVLRFQKLVIVHASNTSWVLRQSEDTSICTTLQDSQKYSQNLMLRVCAQCTHCVQRRRLLKSVALFSWQICGQMCEFSFTEFQNGA